MNLFQTMTEGRHWMDDTDTPADDIESRESQRAIWVSILRLLREAFDIVCQIVNDGLQHAGLVLEILPQPKASKAHDIESDGKKISIGEPGFAENLNKTIQSFHDRRSKVLRKWISEHRSSANERLNRPSDILQRLQTVAVKDLAQLYMLLFLEKMVSTSLVNGISIGSPLLFRCIPPSKESKSWFRSRTRREQMGQ